MKILYVHGLGSNGNGNTVNWIREKFTDHEIYSFDIPFDPDEAIKFIKMKCKELSINTIIGTSLGGFYAMQIHGYYKILINPAIKAYEVAKKIGYGTYNYFGNREDNINTYTIDENFYNKLFNQYNKHITTIDKELKLETYGLFGNNDELCDYKNDFRELYNKDQMITADFGHRLTDNIFNNEFTTLFNTVVERTNNERFWWL